MANPFLSCLGLPDDARVMIPHVDDVGMLRNSIDAFAEAVEFGTATCGSAIVPSPWLPALAERVADHPEWDLGLHLALNCEFGTYKWRPISTMDPATGLVDEHGYMTSNKLDTVARATPQDVHAEVLAQIALARRLGIEPTHVDTHSMVLWDARFVADYAGLYDEVGVVPALGKADVAAMTATIESMPPGKDRDDFSKMLADFQASASLADDFEARGIPVADNMSMTPLTGYFGREERLDAARRAIDGLPEGTITVYVFHALKPGTETDGLQRFTEGRIGDYELLMNERFKSYLEGSGVTLLGWRDLVQAMPR